MTNIKESNLAQIEAIKILIPDELDRCTIINAIVKRFAQEMRDVLENHPNYNGEQIVAEIQEIEGEDPKDITKHLLD